MNKSRQRGVSLIGMLLWGMVVVFMALLVFKLLPAYIEYFTIKKVLMDIGQQPEVRSMSNADIRERFTRRTEIDTIRSVKPADLDITREKGVTIISADYQFQTKLVGNISLLVDFHASSDSGESRTVQQGE